MIAFNDAARLLDKMPRGKPVDAADRARRLARIRRLAWLLDAAVKLPGTKFRFGLNSVIGLAPAAGDAAMTAVSLYIVYEAYGQAITAPRNPGGITAGTSSGNQGRMNSTVGQIDNKLLNQEKSRPTLPGQAPSPSQAQPGGTASTPH